MPADLTRDPATPSVLRSMLRRPIFLAAGLAASMACAAGPDPRDFNGFDVYTLLLRANLYGLAVCCAGFLMPLAWRRVRPFTKSATA